MIHAMAKQQASRSKFLRDVKANEKAIQQQQQLQQQLQQQQYQQQQLQQHKQRSHQVQPQRHFAQHEELTASLASARGIAPTTGSNTSKATGTAHLASGAKKKLSEEDPFYKFYSSINSVFTKTFNASIEKAKEERLHQVQNHSSALHKNGMSSSGGASESEANSAITSLMLPIKFDNESFYVVPNTNKSSIEELATENANLRQMINRTSIQLHAYETATKKQKDALKNNLMLLRNEFNSRESARNRQHEEEIEALTSEIDKLKIQIGRMKSRWDDLKESARKRREESVTDDEDKTSNDTCIQEETPAEEPDFDSEAAAEELAEAEEAAAAAEVASVEVVSAEVVSDAVVVSAADVDNVVPGDVSAAEAALETSALEACAAEVIGEEATEAIEEVVWKLSTAELGKTFTTEPPSEADAPKAPLELLESEDVPLPAEPAPLEPDEEPPEPDPESEPDPEPDPDVDPEPEVDPDPDPDPEEPEPEDELLPEPQ
ncbi:Kinesin-like protein [Sugiyamaella lignohabitans]|uniref:Kinesin-like protein n=1 Tax=Sugiyamaella lignohabitans TaxID=796027 RepID=A0A167CQG6_9ASCO|nr:Kinesin-like protein [Sugiyamaella lignohabitans]ANB11984.1 Kinesin-like protein [Sugiyamaella lignohabitans]